MTPDAPFFGLDLGEALTTTGAVRRFSDRPVPDHLLYRILDAARYAPSGGNRQGWRVVVVEDPDVRRELRDIYVQSAREYMAVVTAGLVPSAPITDRRAEADALEAAPGIDLRAFGDSGTLALELDRAPALLALLVDQRALAASDRDLDRCGIVGGASVYPFAWSILLAARGLGLGGVLTTMTTRYEPQVRELLHAGAELAVAGTIVLGHPHEHRLRLRRQPVDRFATVDRIDGPAFAPEPRP
jgi:nitroreductase